MKKIIWLFLFIPAISIAQVSFSHFYDYDETVGPAVFRNMIATADGGYAMVGSVYHTPWSEYDNQGNEILNYTNDILLVKTDSLFNVMWTKIYYSVIDFSYEEEGIKIKEKPNGGFVLLTETEDPQGIYYFGRPANLISTDATGTMLWSRSFSATTGYDKPFDFLIDDTDNSIVVAGSTNFSAGSRRPWTFKTDSTGALLWGNTYTTSQGEFRSIVKASSGGYLLAGKRNTDAMLMSMTANGTNIWTRTYTTAAAEGAQTAIKSGSGYAMLINNTTAGSCQLVQTDSGGTVTSVKSYLQFAGVSLVRNGNSFLITGNQGTASILSFTADLTGAITGVIRKYSIPSFMVTPNDAIYKNNHQYICGTADNQAWLVNVDLANGYSGGCYNSATTLTAQSASFTFATINPAITDLFMESDIDALMVDELIYINQYIICSCSPAKAVISTSSPAQFCTGGYTTIQAVPGNTYQYNWYKDGILLNGETNYYTFASVPGSYSVTVTSTCGSSNSSSVTVMQIAPPVIDSLSTFSAGFGDTILVYGSHLASVNYASIGVSATVLYFSDSLLGIIVPHGATDNLLHLDSSGRCPAFSSQIISILPGPELKLIIFIEGLYHGNGNSTADTIYISLYTDTSPPVKVFTVASLMSSSGVAFYDLPRQFENQRYYIAVKHRNSLETWTNTPIDIEESTVVSFSSNVGRPTN
ncbi:MAG: hypothetical protein ABI772_08805 [Bacteroidota bacterium]